MYVTSHNTLKPCSIKSSFHFRLLILHSCHWIWSIGDNQFMDCQLWTSRRTQRNGWDHHLCSSPLDPDVFLGSEAEEMESGMASREVCEMGRIVIAHMFWKKSAKYTGQEALPSEHKKENVVDAKSNSRLRGNRRMRRTPC